MKTEKISHEQAATNRHFSDKISSLKFNLNMLNQFVNDNLGCDPENAQPQDVEAASELLEKIRHITGPFFQSR